MTSQEEFASTNIDMPVQKISDQDRLKELQNLEQATSDKIFYHEITAKEHKTLLREIRAKISKLKGESCLECLEYKTPCDHGKES